MNLSRYLDFSEFSVSWYFVSLSLCKIFLVSESMSGVQERMLLFSCCLYTFLLFLGLEFSSIAFSSILPLRPSFPVVSGHQYSAVHQALSVNSEHLPWNPLTPCELHLLLIFLLSNIWIATLSQKKNRHKWDNYYDNSVWARFLAYQWEENSR